MAQPHWLLHRASQLAIDIPSREVQIVKIKPHTFTQGLEPPIFIDCIQGIPNCFYGEELENQTW